MTPTRGLSLRPSAMGSRPSTRTVPVWGVRKPSQVSIVVVLPAPLGPRIAVTVPGSTVRVSPSTAVTEPYRMTRSTTSTAG